MNKKLLGVGVLLSTLLLTACTTSDTEPTQGQTSNDNDKKYDIVATSFHEYDWVKNVIGLDSNFNVTLLMDTGVDMHSYEPSVEDITTIKNADLFIYNGGVSQNWVAEVIETPENENFESINVMEVLGDNVKDEVAVEGMQSEDSHDHDDDTDDHDHDDDTTDTDDHDHDDDTTDTDDHDHDDDTADTDDHDETEHAAHEDEHVWLSLENALVAVNEINDEVSEIDSENADTYNKNTDKYIDKLEELDENYENAVENANRDTVIFADRFPFLYMMQDYDINYYAAFQGCSAETEASFETITFLTEKVDELDINKLLIIDNGFKELATTINNSSEDKDCETLVLNSMQSVSKSNIDDGISYHDIMSNNLHVLKSALE